MVDIIFYNYRAKLANHAPKTRVTYKSYFIFHKTFLFIFCCFLSGFLQLVLINSSMISIFIIILMFIIKQSILFTLRSWNYYLYELLSNYCIPIVILIYQRRYLENNASKKERIIKVVCLDRGHPMIPISIFHPHPRPRRWG